MAREDDAQETQDKLLRGISRGEYKEFIDVDGSGSFKCKLCSRVFSWQNSLVRHLTCVHAGIKNFHCRRCGKSFKGRHGLKYHIEARSCLRNKSSASSPAAAASSSTMQQQQQQQLGKRLRPRSASSLEPQQQQQQQQPSCIMCGLRFPGTAELLAHARSAHAEVLRDGEQAQRVAPAPQSALASLLQFPQSALVAELLRRQRQEQLQQALLMEIARQRQLSELSKALGTWPPRPTPGTSAELFVRAMNHLNPAAPEAP